MIFWYRAGVAKYGLPTYELTSYFCTDTKLYSSFYSSKHWKTNQNKKNIFWHMRVIWNSNFSNYHAFLNHNPLIHLCIIYGCFCATMGEFNSCNRGLWSINSKLFIIWPFSGKNWEPLIYCSGCNKNAPVVPGEKPQG